MAQQKVVVGEWGSFKYSQLNRVLKPLGVRLVVTRSKKLGKQVAVTAQVIEAKPITAAAIVATAMSAMAQQVLTKEELAALASPRMPHCPLNGSAGTPNLEITQTAQGALDDQYATPFLSS